MPATYTYLGDLERLARAKSREKKRELLARVADLFFMTHSRQSPEDQLLFGAVLSKSCVNMDSETLIGLSRRLSEVDPVPDEILERLLIDDIEVARPLLEGQTTIPDEILVRVLDSGLPLEHANLIAGRPGLSKTVTDVLMGEGNDETLLVLAQNDSAQFSDEGIEMFCLLAPHNEPLRDALLQRTSLDAKTLQKLADRLEGELRRDLAVRHPAVPDKKIKYLSRQRIAEILEQFRRPRSTPLSDAERKRIENMHRTGELTQYVIADLARVQKIHETIYALGLFAGVEPHIVCHILFNAETPALGVLAKSANLNRDAYCTLLHMRALHRKLPDQSLETALRRYDCLETEEARPVLDFLRTRFAEEFSGPCAKYCTHPVRKK